jgi:hypothetical protein
MISSIRRMVCFRRGLGGVEADLAHPLEPPGPVLDQNPQICED